MYSQQFKQEAVASDLLEDLVVLQGKTCFKQTCFGTNIIFMSIKETIFYVLCHSK